MDGIVLLSHGSVLCGAERNLLDLAKSMRGSARTPIVEVAFINYLEPPLGAAVVACLAAGAARIVIVPYFLVAGKFVQNDLAAAVARCRQQHPSIEIVVGNVIGDHERLTEAVLQAAASGITSDRWDEGIATVAAACRENPRCPLYGTRDCRVSSVTAV